MTTFKNDDGSRSSTQNTNTTSTSAFRPSQFPLLEQLSTPGSLLWSLFDESALQGTRNNNHHEHYHNGRFQAQSQQGQSYYLRPFAAQDLQLMVMPSPPHSVRSGGRRRISPCSSRRCFCSPHAKSTVTEIIDVVLRIIQEDEDYHDDKQYSCLRRGGTRPETPTRRGADEERPDNGGENHDDEDEHDHDHHDGPQIAHQEEESTSRSSQGRHQ